MAGHNKKVSFSKSIPLGLFLMGGLFLLFSCKKDDPIPGTESLSLLQIISEDPNFSIMSDALTKTEWADTLQGPGQFTVMAPIDEDFQQMGIGQYEDLQPQKWDSLLQYHILPGNYELEQLNGIVPTLLEGHFIFATKEEESKVINGQVGILAANIPASNGWIHALDAVITPATYSVIEVMDENGFSIFVEAVQKAGLENLLSEDGPFTLFVPSDEAFEGYFEAQGISKEGWLETPELTDFLLYFMLDGDLSAKDLSSGNFPTRLGLEVYISKITDNEIWLNGQAQVTITDQDAGNGIIHGLDSIYSAPDKTLLGEITENEESFSEFLGAMNYSGLWEELDEEKDYTLFAPTDPAFAGYYATKGITGYEDINLEELRDLLRNHIIPGKVYSQDFGVNLQITTLQGGELSLNREMLQANGYGLWEDYYNVNALNGVIHGIQALLEPTDY
ncbi:fasciclin domain-containing protein [Echinicola jeungdonensis]|uniref:Fasciclin domain-containing protein n=1 Tax=Echinicola jeungdonensis TaxID=709343 RepID=A0ABV5J6T8_9BACT|nr:fasciclin domain-containing protein [Echinicola jeungdonensis]MDN3669217.1 fasciclin domain-containing protein [Echinicola jeungdonensis]